MKNNQSLYSEVIEKNFENYSKLKIISGYASSNFLEYVVSNTNKVIIDLYIGMSQEGVSFNEHQKFQTLCKSYPHINVFYQYKGKLTHIKLYNFYGVQSSIAYVGSANFTENGFVNNRELLIRSEENFDYLFDTQVQNSIHCNDKDVESYINFFDDEININIEDDEKETNVKSALHEIIRNFNEKHNIRDLSNGYLLPIVTDEKANKLWYQTGVNGVFHNGCSYLRKANNHSLKEFFTIEEFKIIAYDEKYYNAKLKGNFYRELHIDGWDFYDEIFKWLNLTSEVAINHTHLNDLGYTSFYFEKKEDDVYLMTLVNDF
ncbi:TPA: NgoFVII family restriction endonuclease [Staphylococcus pseudintermedius]|nr:phospholipase D family protein [Staphylococcus pseudintermedius]EJO7168145.1 phospholipase D family protein [Staphylococcus pseudintermedius]ELH0986387.1 phospholipase D family protein [Staphylococcus pseudintermedius]MDK3734406.1 phospholipase D family protein [Staphylococcus pseudintermedius]HAR6248720.1 NgoFVII family restriction endonuclease [Staphylococcus pseudintermedius]